MAEQLGKFLTELPEATSLKSDDLMYVVASNTSKKIGVNNLKKSVSPIVEGAVNGNIASFTDGSDSPLEKCIAEIVPKQAGSGTPSPNNVRAISGSSEVKVYVNQKNFLENKNTVGSQTINGITFETRSDGSVYVHGTNTGSGTTSFYIGVTVGGSNITLPEGEYILSGCPNGGSSGTYFQSLYYGNTAGNNFNKFDFGSGQTYTLDNDTNTGINVRIGIARNASVDTVFYPMIRKATDSEEFEPYNGTTYTTPLGQTVYGGQLNVLTGVLTIDREFITFDGSENWQANAGQNGYTVYNILPTAMTRGNGISNEFFVQTSYYADMSLILGQNNRNIYAIQINNNISGVTDLASWKSWLSNNNCQICYEVAPQTVQLTPQEVDSILGQNNISADTGSIDVVYARDLNIVINDLLERVAALENE